MEKTTFAIGNRLPPEIALKALREIYPEINIEYIGDGVLVSTDSMVAYKINNINGILRGLDWYYNNFPL